MKNLSVLMISSLFLSSVFLSGVVRSSEKKNWSAQSTEKQFEKTSELKYKTSKGDETNVLSLIPSAQSKSAAGAQSKTAAGAKPESAAGARKKTAPAKTLTFRPEVKSLNQEFWVFDASVEFFRDDDRDGFYNHFAVEFEADTEYSSAEIYARLYLGENEVFKEYHTTSNFSIFSDNSNDSFVVESELLNGFFSAEYEVLIELYDAFNDQLVAVYDGNNDADLYLLSLESLEYETTQVIVVREHGGSVSLWYLLLLPTLLITRQYKRLSSGQNG
jgi:hypothetical protein